MGGIYPLREAIAREYLKEFRGMTVLPEQIIIGTAYLYGLLIQLLGTDKIYAVENPALPQDRKRYIKGCWKVACEYIDMDEEGVQIGELQRKRVEMLHTSPSHHYPTGIVMPVSRRYELLGWVAKSNSHYIIEDDYDSELRLGGQPIPTMREHRCLRPRHLHEYIYQDAGIDGPHQLHDSAASASGAVL